MPNEFEFSRPRRDVIVRPVVPVQDLHEAAGADRAGGSGERRREKEAAADHPVGRRRGRDPAAEDGRQHADGGLAGHPARPRRGEI